jgi:hypothetical protein
VAESPEIGPAPSRRSRARPQVIYHLAPASNYAATLHSQAKRQNNELPIDSSMPTSLQTSHANANAAAAQQQAVAPRVPERNPMPRVRVNRSHSFGKPSGNGSRHGNHSHRK